MALKRQLIFHFLYVPLLHLYLLFLFLFFITVLLWPFFFDFDAVALINY